VEFGPEQLKAMALGQLQAAGAPRPGFASDGSDGILARSRTIYSDSSTGFIDQGGRRFFLNSPRDDDGWGMYQTSVDAIQPGEIGPSLAAAPAAPSAVPRAKSLRWDQAKGYLVDASNAAGTDAGIVTMIANYESDFNPEARPISRKFPALNTVRQFDGTMAMSTAYGYGQFTDDTWAGVLRQYGTKYGVPDATSLTSSTAAAYRTDPRLQADMLAEFTRANIDLGRTLGGPDDVANVYALHNLGGREGPKFLKALAADRDTLVSEVLRPVTITNNSSLYSNGSISLGEAYARMGQAMRLGQIYADQARLLQNGPR
jgi:hypothetical protein